jgi:hypothetical protein
VVADGVTAWDPSAAPEAAGAARVGPATANKAAAQPTTAARGRLRRAIMTPAITSP